MKKQLYLVFLKLHSLKLEVFLFFLFLNSSNFVNILYCFRKVIDRNELVNVLLPMTGF